MKNQRKFKKHLSLMLAIVLAFAFMPTASLAFEYDYEHDFSYDYNYDYEPEIFSQLDAPTNLRLSDDGILTWGSVAGATGYAVHINLNNVVYTQDAYIYLWDFLTCDSIFTVRIRALGDGGNTLDSNLSDAFDVESPRSEEESSSSYNYFYDDEYDYDYNDDNIYKYKQNELAGVVAFSNDITDSFECFLFESIVRLLISKPDGRIYDTDVDGINNIFARGWGITSLSGIEYFTALRYLYVGYNQLTELDVSNNTALIELVAYNNQLTKLDVSNNTVLTYIFVSWNQLTELDLSDNIALTSLVADNNQLATLDMSNNIALTVLSVEGNQITELDMSNNAALEALFLSANHITELDVSNNISLTHLYIASNQLTELDVSNNTELIMLLLTQNKLTELDVSNNNELVSLYVGGNQLTKLDVSNNTTLMDLFANNNQLTKLDVSNNAALWSLYIGGNQLTELDVSSNASLSTLYVGYNQLTELDVSNNPILFNLHANGNQLAELDLFNNTNLFSLHACGNNLTGLDVSNNTRLWHLYVYGNQLTELDVSSNIRLTHLAVGDNQLSELSVSNNTALEFLSASWNNLRSLDVSNNVALNNPTAYNNLNVAMNFMTAPTDVIGWEAVGLTLRSRDGTVAGTFIFWEQRVATVPPTPPTPPSSGGGGGGRSVETIVANIPDYEVPLATVHSPYLAGFPDGEIKGERYISREEAAVILFRIREGMISPTPASAAPFIDVPASRWSAGYIRYVKENGLLSGYPDGTFRPTGSMSRNEFAVLVLNLMDLEPIAETPYDFPLTDVPSNWAASYIYAVFEAGFIIGFADGTFRGNTFVTRSQAANMLNNALDRSPVPSEWADFTDIPFTDLRRGYWAFYDLLEASIEHSHLDGELILLP